MNLLIAFCKFYLQELGVGWEVKRGCKELYKTQTQAFEEAED